MIPALIEATILAGVWDSSDHALEFPRLPDKYPRTNNQGNPKKIRITANNRVIIRGIRICQISRILSNNCTIRGFFLSNTSRIVFKRKE